MGHCCTPIKVPKVANFHINHTDNQLEVVLTNGQTFSVSQAELEEFLGGNGGNGVSDVIVEGGELKVVSADGTKKTVALPTATTTRDGIVMLATPAEVTAGTNNTKAVTPAGVKAATDETLADAKAYADQLARQNAPKPVPAATTTTAGTIGIATTAEAKAGTDNTSAMTPATTKAAVEDALGSDSNKATATKLGTVKLGNRALANDGSTVLGYFVNA